MTRYVTSQGSTFVGDSTPDSTVRGPEIQDPEAYRLYRLCQCETCKGTGKRPTALALPNAAAARCPDCRGEGRSLDLVATAGTKEAVGVALVTLAGEGEWDECPFGLMHRPEGEKGRWLLKPWGPSARNITDAARTLAKVPRKNTTH